MANPDRKLFPEEKSWIPEISDQRLKELTARIKPIVRFAQDEIGFTRNEDGAQFYIEDVDPRNVAFTWDPKPTTEASGLTTLTDIRTYHSWGYYGFFKPSVAEVLAQIPEELVDRVAAFEIVDHPRTSQDLHRESEALNAGYHVASTRLFTTES